MAKFEYRGGDRTVESVVRKSKQSSGNYDRYTAEGIPGFKPKEGENCLRILPPTWKDTEKWGDGWEVQVHLHSNVGVDNGQYLCLDKMLGVTCPPCGARQNEGDSEAADALRVGWRALCWVVDRDNEKAGPQLWSMPPTVFRDVCAASVDKKAQTPILIDDPEEGYDVMFNREGSGLRTKYTRVEVAREATPLHDNQKLQDRWLDYITENPLPDTLHYFSAEHIEKVLFGRAERGEEGETRKPISKRRGEDDEKAEEPRSRSRRSAPEDDDKQPGDRPLRRGGRDLISEDEPENPRERKRSREEPEAEGEVDNGRGSSRRRASEPEEDEKPRGGVARRKPSTDPEDDAEAPEEKALARASSSGKERLQNLRRTARD